MKLSDIATPIWRFPSSVVADILRPFAARAYYTSIRDSFVMTHGTMAWHFRDSDSASQIAMFVNMTQYRIVNDMMFLSMKRWEIFNRYSDVPRHARFVF